MQRRSARCLSGRRTREWGGLGPFQELALKTRVLQTCILAPVGTPSGGSHTCTHAGVRPWGTHTCILAAFMEVSSYLHLHACRYVLGSVLLSPLLICDLSSLLPLPRRQAAAPAHPPPPSASVLPIRLRIRHTRRLFDQRTVCAAAAALRDPGRRARSDGGARGAQRDARSKRGIGGRGGQGPGVPPAPAPAHQVGADIGVAAEPGRHGNHPLPRTRSGV